MRRVIAITVLLAAVLASAHAQHFGGRPHGGGFRGHGGAGFFGARGFHGPVAAAPSRHVVVHGGWGGRRAAGTSVFVGAHPSFFNNGFFFKGGFFGGHHRFRHHHHRFFFGAPFAPFFDFPFWQPFFGVPWGWGGGAYPVYVNAPPTYVVRTEAEPVVRYEPPPPQPPPPREEAAYPQPSTQPKAERPALPPTVLVFKDQHRLEAQNYAIVGAMVYVFGPQRTRKIPLAELDLAATGRVNEERGVTFRVPAHAKEVVTYP